MGLDWPVQGTGADRERRKQNNRAQNRRELMWLVLLQVGVKSASDYETFVWVRENELPEINEVIQVKCN